MGEIGDILPGTEIGSSENVVDCAFDLGKRRLATISSQGTIRIFERPERQDEWIEASTWDLPGKPSLCRVCWSSPVYGMLLAVGSSEGEITLWSPKPQVGTGSSRTPYQKEGSVSILGPPIAMEFAPRDKGLSLAVASAKQVRVFKPSPRGDGSWQLESEVDSSRVASFTSLAWQPSGRDLPPLLLIGSHNHAEADISAVAWANSANRPRELIAVASKQEVHIFGLTAQADKPQVEQVSVLKQPAAVRKLGWHPLASWLAVSLVSSEVHLWRPNLAGEWKLIQRLVGSPERRMDQ